MASDFNEPRLDENQVRELSAALVDEQTHLTEMTAERFLGRDRDKPAWWRGFDPRWARVYEAAQERATRRLSELLASAGRMDLETAALELGTLWSQAFTLQAVAQGVAGGAGAQREPWPNWRYTAAVEALMRFYLGEHHRDDGFLGETQLAWAATQVSPLALRQKSVRQKRRMASRRYSELWEAWARSTGP